MMAPPDLRAGERGLVSAAGPEESLSPFRAREREERGRGNGGEERQGVEERGRGGEETERQIHRIERENPGKRGEHERGEREKEEGEREIETSPVRIYIFAEGVVYVRYTVV